MYIVHAVKDYQRLSPNSREAISLCVGNEIQDTGIKNDMTR